MISTTGELGSIQFFPFFALLTAESLRVPSADDPDSDKVFTLYGALLTAKDQASFRAAAEKLLAHFGFNEPFVNKIDWRQFDAETIGAVKTFMSKSFLLESYDGGACRNNFKALVKDAIKLES